ncbi:MAG: methyltransferase type 12 [Candidatus Dactylopiibacterium carminicum]|nr:MAG: methyltransferase type 12 [Candidatus Dactylopiibacterium carminicum]
MANPWLEIPLTDYESHMALPAIAQAQMLADGLVTALQRFTPDTVAIVGCAGGNGFDRIPASTRRVVGVDINPDYIAAASTRYGAHISGLELHVADIQAGPLPFEPVELLYAALVFEYVSLPTALRHLAQACQPGGHLISVLQLPAEQLHAVSPSPYRSLQTLPPLMRLVPPDELAASATLHGFTQEAEYTTMLDSGKAFATQVFRRTSG